MGSRLRGGLDNHIALALPLFSPLHYHIGRLTAFLPLLSFLTPSPRPRYGTSRSYSATATLSECSKSGVWVCVCVCALSPPRPRNPRAPARPRAPPPHMRLYTPRVRSESCLNKPGDAAETRQNMRGTW